MNLLQSLTQSVNLLQEEVSTITRHLGQFTTPPTNIKLSHVPRSSQTNSSIITNSANISTSRIQLHDSLLSMSYSSSMLIQPPVWNNANSVNFLNNNALFVYSHNFMPSPLRVCLQATTLNQPVKNNMLELQTAPSPGLLDKQISTINAGSRCGPNHKFNSASLQV